MVELAILQAVSYIMGSLGVFVAAIYYAITLRGNNRARQAQLYMGLFNRFSDLEINRHYLNVCEKKWWKHEDPLKKFSPDNPEKYISLCTMLSYYEGLGILVEEGLIDFHLVYTASSEAIRVFWETVAPNIEHYRRTLSIERFGKKAEYLYGRVMEQGEKSSVG